MAYTNFTHCTVQEYVDVIYSQDDKNKAKIWFNDVELQDFSLKCEKITKKTRIIPEDGKKIFSLSNFVSTELEVILHDVDLEDIVDQVKISIGTLVDEENDTYEYVPLGIFNIQNVPVINDNKITLKLRDNRVKFDFNYNAKPLIDLHGGSATKRQILDDICTQAGVTNDITEFEFEDDEISIYDSTIKASTYIYNLAEQCGCIPTINRNGHLIFIDFANLYTWRIPKSILPKPYTLGTPYQIQRVVYESGIIKYQSSDDETLDTLFLDSSNSYIDRQEQIDYIYNLLDGFTIDTVVTQKMLGNPCIDPYDLIEVYDDNGPEESVLFKTLANQIYTFNGVHRQQFSTEIGKEQRTENVKKNNDETFKRWATTEINNLDATVTIHTGEIGDRTNKQTTITQDIDGIASQVQDIPTITTENEGTGILFLYNLANTKLINLKIHPTNEDIIGLFASPLLKVREGLKVLSRGITFDGNTDVYYKLPDNLYYYDNEIYDEFVYDGLDEEIYVIHRVAVDEQGNKSILQEPIKENYEYENIIVEEGNYNVFMSTYPTAYIYVKAMIKNDYTDTFATSYEVDSKITQTANEINFEVNKKVGNDEIISKINQSAEQISIMANKIALEGITTINNGFNIDLEGNMICNNAELTGGEIKSSNYVANTSGTKINLTDGSIDTKNFKVSSNGSINSVSGNIGGFSLGEHQFVTTVSKQYNFTQTDVTKLRNYIMGTGTLTDAEKELYDVTGDGQLTAQDYGIMTDIINNTSGKYPNQKVTATFILDTEEAKRSIKILDSLNKISTSIGLFSISSNNISTNHLQTNGISSNSISINNNSEDMANRGSFTETTLDGVDGVMLRLGTKIFMYSQNGNIQCVSLTQTSLKENKKNFEKLKSGLDIIKNIDIYKYNMSNEDKNTKKHIGFVIDDKYNYSQEITSQNNDGVDLYSFVSVCCKAIQEQQEQIEKLQKELQSLKESDK